MPVVACVISSLILNVSLKFENAQLSLFSLIFQKVFFFYYYSLLEKHNNAATYSPHLDTAVLLHSGVQGDVQAGRMVECTREVLLYYECQVLIIQHTEISWRSRPGDLSVNPKTRLHRHCTTKSIMLLLF